MRQHGAQVVKIEQQEAFRIRCREDDVQHAFLHIVQLKKLREEQGAHF